jgi:anti-sigma factor RsiW
MTYNADTIKEMIPLYVNGKLAEQEKKAFLQGLKEYPELAQEVADFREIDVIYKDLEAEIPFPDPDAVFNRIMDNIDRQGAGAREKAPVRKVLTPGFREKLIDFFRTGFMSPRVAWSVAAVQIVLLAAILVALPGRSAFETLTYSGNGLAARQELNVVFDEDAVEKDIRALMVRAGATIVGGPSTGGLYIIAIAGDQDAEAVSAVLRNSGIVSFVEQRY